MKTLWLHYTILLLHVGAGLFWLGWMVFIFFLLTPVLREKVPDRIQAILPALKRRIRRVVFWLILIIVATGLHNVYFNNLYRPDRLFRTDYGHRFLIKLGAAMVLFSVYALAPYLTGGASDGNSTSTNNTMMVFLHVIAFSTGTLAAFLGLTL